MNNLDVAVAALAVSAILGTLTARRAAYDRVIRALDLISDGDIAKARHRIGALFYEHREEIKSGQALGLPSDEVSDCIEDVFTLLWAARRLNAIRVSLGPRWPGSPTTRPMPGVKGPALLLEASARSWIAFWVEPLSDVHRTGRLHALAKSLGAHIDDDDLEPLTELAATWVIRP